MFNPNTSLKRIIFLINFLPLLFSCNADQNGKILKNDFFMNEKHRPQFHFSPEAHWMNDPNGMVFFEGEYHLFYQHYPDSTIWGPMHWGHAVSSDLIHWEHLPIAIYPDSLGYIFSGSAVYDENNTSGLGANGTGPLIAIFTHHDANLEKAGSTTFQYQSIAFSNDKGRSWEKYEGNPVLPNPGIKNFRDPKVMWYEPEKKWIMTLAADDRIKFYSSSDFKSWEETGEFGAEHGGHGGVWECPDLFPMPVEETGETKWVLLVSINPGGPNGGSAAQYFVGDFDGKKFTLDVGFAPHVTLGNAKWVDHGKDNYAGVTWSNISKEDGRRLFIGWMSNWQYAQVVPTEVWRSANTLPRNLTLRYAANQFELRSNPVKELVSLEGETKKLEPGLYEGEKILSAFANHPLQKIALKFKNPTSGSIVLRLSNSKNEYIDFGYNSDSTSYFVDRSKAGDSTFSNDFAGKHTALASYTKNEIDMLIYLDVSSLELFADGGRTVMTQIFFPSEPFNQLTIIEGSNRIELIEGTTTDLTRIWPDKADAAH